MSVAFAAPRQRGKGEITPAAIQKMLDENNHLIQCIMDYQNKGKASECSQYQQILHTNLVYLATIADSNQNMQSLLPAPPTQTMPMGPGGMSQSGPPPPPRSHNMPSDGMVGGGPPAPHMQNQMNGQMPVLPPQPGRVAVVTGATAGIGQSTARQLARLGVCVVVAGNDERRGQEVVSSIRAEMGSDRAHFLSLDLASLASVRGFARDFRALGLPLHLLVNHAGVMLEPRAETEDGFERHLGVNFLGHFLLTLLLLPALRASGAKGRGSRVVTVGSATHYVGAVDMADLHGRHAYSPFAAYAQSKLALALFALQLQRILDARGDPVTSNMADPGVVDTELYRHARWVLRAVKRFLGWLVFKSPEEGAWTSVCAAAAPELEGVGGRDLRDEAEAEPPGAARDREPQRRLWAEGRGLTGAGGGDGDVVAW